MLRVVSQQLTPGYDQWREDPDFGFHQKEEPDLYCVVGVSHNGHEVLDNDYVSEDSFPVTIRGLLQDFNDLYSRGIESVHFRNIADNSDVVPIPEYSNMAKRMEDTPPSTSFGA